MIDLTEKKQTIATLEFKTPVFLSEGTQIEVRFSREGEPISLSLVTLAFQDCAEEDRPRLLTDIIFLGKKLPEGWPDEAER